MTWYTWVSPMTGLFLALAVLVMVCGWLVASGRLSTWFDAQTPGPGASGTQEAIPPVAGEHPRTGIEWTQSAAGRWPPTGVEHGPAVPPTKTGESSHGSHEAQDR
ncbi:MAG: hypothetical protein ACK5KU_02470 [Beutenbergiaceae bacterium]